MRRSRSFALVALLATVACERWSPTEPQVIERELAENVHGVSLAPSLIRVGVNQTTTATARLASAGPEVWFSSSDKTIAEVSGKIAFGSQSTTVQIRGVSPGQVEIVYMIPNFGRAPGTGRAGSVTVLQDYSPPPECNAPMMLDHPLGATIRPGEHVTLSAMSRGTKPASWQWFVDDGDGALDPISGATESTYRTPPLFATTEYAASVTNACGQAMSNRARVVVASTRRRAVRR